MITEYMRERITMPLDKRNDMILGLENICRAHDYNPKFASVIVAQIEGFLYNNGLAIREKDSGQVHPASR
jgi:hypothetical protein